MHDIVSIGPSLTPPLHVSYFSPSHTVALWHTMNCLYQQILFIDIFIYFISDFMLLRTYSWFLDWNIYIHTLWHINFYLFLPWSCQGTRQTNKLLFVYFGPSPDMCSSSLVTIMALKCPYITWCTKDNSPEKAIKGLRLQYVVGILKLVLNIFVSYAHAVLSVLACTVLQMSPQHSSSKFRVSEGYKPLMDIRCWFNL